jgi:hypothetical protein
MNIPDYKVPDLAEVSARVADGIALGGDYMEVFMQYVQAHHDRAYLLKLFSIGASAIREIRDNEIHGGGERSADEIAYNVPLDSPMQISGHDHVSLPHQCECRICGRTMDDPFSMLGDSISPTSPSSDHLDSSQGESSAGTGGHFFECEFCGAEHAIKGAHVCGDEATKQSRDQQPCKQCGHSYTQHSKGPVRADYCRHCPCPGFQSTSGAQHE